MLLEPQAGLAAFIRSSCSRPPLVVALQSASRAWRDWRGLLTCR